MNKQWQQEGARAQLWASWPRRFVAEHVTPLLWNRTRTEADGGVTKQIVSEEAFWGVSGSVAFRSVELCAFRVVDWFPRAPGVYWSHHARKARERIFAVEPLYDPDLGSYWSPDGKACLVEDGGIGTIRLRPRSVDDDEYWFATAVKHCECHAGIPLLVPHALLAQHSVKWGSLVNLRGRVRFLQDCGLEDIGDSVHHARPLVVAVDELAVTSGPETQTDSVVITPVSLFQNDDTGRHQLGYTFVQVAAEREHQLDAASDWMDHYAKKHGGRVITNFDEQRPTLANAPLSYQRLVTKTYERALIAKIMGPVYVERVDRIIQQASVNGGSGNIHMGNSINVGGSAIINIDSVLTNVAQTIGSAPGLQADEKQRLEELAGRMNSQLETLKTSHPDEVREIAVALDKAVGQASKAAPERKRSLLTLSANGLKDAAELLKDIAPGVIATADLIARFISGL